MLSWYFPIPLLHSRILAPVITMPRNSRSRRPRLRTPLASCLQHKETTAWLQSSLQETSWVFVYIIEFFFAWHGRIVSKDYWWLFLRKILWYVLDKPTVPRYVESATFMHATNIFSIKHIMALWHDFVLPKLGHHWFTIGYGFMLWCWSNVALSELDPYEEILFIHCD